MSDPFSDIRDKRMGELDAEQKDRATELWLRIQIGPSERYWYRHLQALFRVIDRLREAGAKHQRLRTAVQNYIAAEKGEGTNDYIARLRQATAELHEAMKE